MKVIGFNFDKQSIERKGKSDGKMSLKSGLNIEAIEKQTVPLSDKPALNFKFVYTVDYNPKVANVELKGNVLALSENDEAEEIITAWKKKKFDHPAKMPLFNFILTKCNVKALSLEEEFNLPLHIPLPKLKEGKKE